MNGNNPSVIDVELLNPYQGIYAVGAARHYIARVVCPKQDSEVQMQIKEFYSKDSPY